MRKGGLDELQAAIKAAGRNINNLSYADDTTLIAETRGTKEPPLTCQYPFTEDPTEFILFSKPYLNRHSPYKDPCLQILKTS